MKKMLVLLAAALAIINIVVLGYIFSIQSQGSPQYTQIGNGLGCMHNRDIVVCMTKDSYVVYKGVAEETTNK